MNSPLLTQDIIDEVVRAEKFDAFALFGMHDYAPDKKRMTVFLPGALSVTVIDVAGKAQLGILEQVHDDGLFTGLLNQKEKTAYRLKVEYPLSTQILEDPYRFPSLLTETDCYLFNTGVHEQAYHFLGANHYENEGVTGVLFAVWAPNAKRVSVVGDFNHWDGRVHIMRKNLASNIWEIFLPGVEAGSAYKYEIIAADGTLLPLKADPYAKQMQLRPENASLVHEPGEYLWQDSQWLQSRQDKAKHTEAVSIYEVHLGSWRRTAGDDFLSYRELANDLIAYVKMMGFTHIQLMPISEYPFDGSWGYQPLGLFAPSSRFGKPEDFKFFVDAAHQENIGILLDWVPGHFPSDDHGLGFFDGSHLYEHADPRQGFHPDWNTLIYNYGRAEVTSYLISNAMYWLDEFHLDGLRFDAVASMLYLDYSRKEGEWIPNYHGGRENLEAIELLRSINSRAYFNFPGIMMIAEESTAWPGVTDFIERGGLGFGFKWNMGWMNDTLSYLSRDAIHRKYHHNEITFGLLYAFSENFILPLSHDEVVHGKRSLLEKIPGDDWQKFATLRAYYSFMWTHPGKKLLFMGGEFAQRDEWTHERSLDWHLLEYEPHQQIQTLVKDLNSLYVDNAALSEMDFSEKCFEWIDADNHGNSIYVYLRKNQDDALLVALNMTPTVHHEFRIGVNHLTTYHELFNSNDMKYGGTGLLNPNDLVAENISSHGRDCSIKVTLPALSLCIFRVEGTTNLERNNTLGSTC